MVFFKVIFPHFVAIVDPSMNKGRIGCFNNCNLSVPSNTEVLVCVTEVLNNASLTIGSSKSYSERLRKFYRTMNVPVPQPLPSLVELMKANKCAKRKFEL